MKRRNGQAVDYAMILGLMMCLALGAVGKLGERVSGDLGEVNSVLDGTSDPIDELFKRGGQGLDQVEGGATQESQQARLLSAARKLRVSVPPRGPRAWLGSARKIARTGRGPLDPAWAWAAERRAEQAQVASDRFAVAASQLALHQAAELAALRIRSRKEAGLSRSERRAHAAGRRAWTRTAKSDRNRLKRDWKDHEENQVADAAAFEEAWKHSRRARKPKAELPRTDPKRRKPETALQKKRQPVGREA